jgi:hypothetical protein
MSSSTSRTLQYRKAINSATHTESNIFFDTYPFVDNQMKEPKNEATQYESPNEGSGTAGSSDSYESPSPPQFPCAKRKRSSGTEDPDYIPEQLVYDH